ncbi:M48 family metalloprotease, partial [Actinosynnema sp. NPDC059797]
MRVALPERVARPAPAGGAPTGLVALFLLLVTTVVATIGILGLLAWLAVGEHRQALGAEFRRCGDLEQGPPQTLIEANDASHRLLDCLAPTYRQQAGWALAAVAVLVVVTAALYCAYPRWLLRRRRFVPLRESGELAEHLDGLRDLVGLRARPVYLLGSRSGTTDALTFGALRRRYVALDAGLLRSFDADRARFRAVVLHELAHARSQDVHITYLTKSIWWAFVAVAWAPALAGVLAAGSWWGLVVVAALLVLTALVLCTRNAILRERELHADGVAAALDGPGTALAELVADERPRGSWRALVGHHPSPALRRRVVADPALLLRPRWWEMPVAGLTTGVVAANLGFVVAIALPTLPGSGQLLTGLLTSPGLVVPLAVAAWRVAAVSPGRLPASLPVFALAWAGAFLVGQQVALLGLIRASERTVVPTPDLASALVLAATALVVAVWAAGASRVVAGAFDRPPRWALPAVVAGGAVAFAPWFGSWSVWSSVDRVGWWAFADELARFELDVPGASSWVAGAAHWLGLLHMPLYSMVFFPAVVPALALLWLVPALVTRAGRPVLDVRRALRAGAVGVAAFTVAAVALVVAARFA